MRLLVIGTSARAQIKINSQYASGYHAEIIQLDNGDMFIIDKKSTNGTYVNGQRIEPDKEVPISRGTNVMLADAPLDWNQVPALVVDRNAKALISVGTHYRNRVRISGDRASRFHATIKQTKDGKWWICDHSTNGTTVNGVRISRDRFVPLKRGDKIMCAGQEVENPAAGSGSVGKVIGIVCGSIAAVAAVIAIVIGLGGFISKSDSKIYEQNKSALVFIRVGYHYHISCPPMEIFEPGKLARILHDTDFTLDKDGDIQPYNNYDRSIQDKPLPIISSATGFFISNDGLVATNLHVAKPWLFDEGKYRADAMELLIGKVLHAYGSGLAEYQKDLKVEGVLDFIEVTPNGRFLNEKNALPCEVYAASSDSNIDVSIIKLQSETGALPKGCSYINLNKCKEVKNGEHIFTMGYPLGDLLQTQGQTLQAASAGGYVMKVDKVSFTHNATTHGGASGSPLLNKKGQIVGIHHAHTSAAEEYRYAVKAKYIKWLLEQEKEKKI